MSGPILLNEIKRRGIVPYGKDDIAIEWTKLLFGAIDEATVFTVDNVAEWFVQQKSGSGRFEIERDLPCIVPPYPLMWIEYRDFWDSPLERVGLLILTEDFGLDDDGGTKSVSGRLSEWTRKTPQPQSDFSRFGAMRWFVNIFPVARGKGAGPVGPLKLWALALNPDGAVARSSDGEFNNFALYSNTVTPPMVEAAKTLEAEGLMALSFLNCKNVVTTEHLPSRQERRLAERKGEPITRFHTLSIEPMKKVLQTEGGIATNGLKKALHICRGHFAHYSEDKPLFGKYSGQFWIPAHVRGSADAGQVIKDYDVKAPKGAQAT